MPNLPPLLGKDVFARILEAIENAGYKRNRAALEMKMPSSTIYSWVNRTKEPGDDSMRKVAELTGYSVAEIRGADGDAVQHDDPEQLKEFLLSPSGKRAAQNPRALDWLRAPHFRRAGMPAEGYQDLFRAFEASEAGRSAETARIDEKRKETAAAQDSEKAAGRVMLTQRKPKGPSGKGKK